MKIPQTQTYDTLPNASEEEVRYVLAAILDHFKIVVDIEQHPHRKNGVILATVREGRV